ncbi:hypothetical protein AJ80_02176 [Polytolypa hystricis UAMH7299]|uniref:Major facilitator superfamily (MFS) profile domain-containing protein n=1 Tax=Polytolypa hystricis (strain UAMH7299) TaxID=1447883 RepID=A0A2B7YSZ7_POLH7|nr:hypothetical protein AJ80_02176 [Polytolypa hystricis UAMH7299]
MGSDKQSERGPFESGAITPRPSSINHTLPRESSENTLQTSIDDADSDRNRTEDSMERINSKLGQQEGDDPEKDAEALESSGIQDASPLKDPNLVEWDGPADPDNPVNWSLAKKWYITMMLALVTFCVTFSSSIFSQATGVTAELYGVSTEVTTLATSLVVLGFGLGPLVWGPLSELYGRMIPLFTGFAIFVIFQIPVATAQNLHTIMICRFLIGAFGCAPLAIIGGAMTDFWDPVARGVAVALFAGATFIGPIAGPIAGGFIVNSHLGWRWTAWVTLIISASFGIVGVFTVPETYAPVILQRRAARLRRETRNWALHSTLDEHRPTMSDIVTKYLSRPLQMLVLEPILLLVTIYLSIIYGILYLFFFAYPISFQEVRGWKNPGVAALPFIGLFAGIICGCVLIIYLTKTRFAHKMKKHGRVIPEERLPPMIIAGVSLPAGLFWFSWTSKPEISWVAQTFAGVPIGLGIIVIFLQGLNYLIDVYLMYTNSAFAANTLVRSAFGAAFPLFATQMYHKLGVEWAGSLLGFLTAAMIPVPLLFYMYGKKIRAKSRFVPKL